MLGKIRIRRPSPGTVLGGLALIVAMSGVAVAAIPGGDGTVTACINAGGAVKVIDAEAGTTCAGNQQTVRLASTDATGRVADAERLDGQDSTEFLSGGWAQVGSSGALTAGARVDGAGKVGTGTYRVQFTDDAYNCAILATLGEVEQIPTEQGQAVANENFRGDVIVRTADSAGNPTDRAFSVAILC